jgi:hypothetical protein
MPLTSGQNKSRAKSRTLSERLSSWYERIMELSRGSEIATMSPSDVQRLAQDVGVSPEDLRALDRHGADSTGLLVERLDALDLDAAEIAQRMPGTFHDLERLCTLCRDKGKCSRDLRKHAADNRWRDYCPNAGTLADLNTLPWASRRDW